MGDIPAVEEGQESPRGGGSAVVLLRRGSASAGLRSGASASLSGGPVLPAAPAVDLPGAGEVGSLAAGSSAAVAGVPVEGVDLEETDVVLVGGGDSGVLADGVQVAAALSLDDALAAGLVPGVLGADGGDLGSGEDVSGGAAEAVVAVAARAVAAAVGRGVDIEGVVGNLLDSLHPQVRGADHEGDERQSHSELSDVHFAWIILSLIF